jgi:hypothetical protein
MKLWANAINYVGTNMVQDGYKTRMALLLSELYNCTPDCLHIELPLSVTSRHITFLLF